jgi:hypothetical protein
MHRAGRVPCATRRRETEERRSMRTLLVAVVERISARNVAEVVGVVLAAVLVAMLLGLAGLSFGD